MNDERSSYVQEVIEEMKENARTEFEAIREVICDLQERVEEIEETIKYLRRER